MHKYEQQLFQISFNFAGAHSSSFSWKLHCHLQISPCASNLYSVTVVNSANISGDAFTTYQGIVILTGQQLPSRSSAKHSAVKLPFNDILHRTKITLLFQYLFFPFDICTGETENRPNSFSKPEETDRHAQKSWEEMGNSRRISSCLMETIYFPFTPCWLSEDHPNSVSKVICPFWSLVLKTVWFSQIGFSSSLYFHYCVSCCTYYISLF